MSTLSIGGLSTGLDTKTIISQLMSIEAQPQTQMQWKQQLWTARKSAWSDLNTRLLSLQTSANTLINPSTWDPTAFAASNSNGTFTSTTGDPARLLASVSGTPTAGTYTVDVTQLALAEMKSSTTTTATDPGVQVGGDTLQITKGGTTTNVALAAGDQLSDIVAKINATSGTGVVASMVSGKLQLKSSGVGAGEAFSVASAGGTAATLGFVQTQGAQDAIYAVNGTTMTSSTNNNVSTGITGVNLTFLGTTSTTVMVAPGSTSGMSQQDAWIASVLSKVHAFADSYNASLDFVQQKTQGESKVASPKTLGDFIAGPVARDVQFSGVGFDLRNQMSDAVSGMPTGSGMLSSVGITTSFQIGGASANGKLVIDDAKLTAALKADPTQVQNVLGQVGTSSVGVTSDDGFARRISELVSRMRTGGTVDLATQGATAQISLLQKSIDSMTSRLAKKQQYYEKMYSNLEVVIGKLQSQGSELSARINAMSGGNN